MVVILPPMRARRGPALLLAAVAVTSLSGCSASTPEPGTGADGAPGAPVGSAALDASTLPTVPTAIPGRRDTTTIAPRAVVEVAAASAIEDPIRDIAAAYMLDHPDIRITPTFAPAQDLVAEIEQGGAFDLFVGAEPNNAQMLITDGLATAATKFASVSVGIVVPPGNPAHIDSLSGLARAGIDVAGCEPDVACGKAIAKVLAAAGVTIEFSGVAAKGRGVVSMVADGTADAGLASCPDIVAAGERVSMISVPADVDVKVDFPVVVLDRAPHATEAEAFADYLLGPVAQGLLSARGYNPA